MLTRVLACAVALPFLAPPVPSQDLPDRLLVGYWHNWVSSPNSLTLAQVPAAYDVVNVAFATPSTPFGSTMEFAPDPGLYPAAGDFLTDVQALQAAGKKVLISIGGAADPIHLDTPADATAFATSMLALINTWGFDGLDIDVEGTSLNIVGGDGDFTAPTSPRIVNMIGAITQLLALLPPDFILTAAPETANVQGGYSAYAGVWGSYLALLHAVRNELSYVHVQHYNTGSMFGRDGQIYIPATADFHAAMADMLIGGFPVAGGASFPPLRPDQVAIGLPASPSAAGSGYTTPGPVHEALDLLYLGRTFGGSYALADPDGYPDFRGVMTWSVNWDVDGGGAFSSSHRTYLDDVLLATNPPSISMPIGGTITLELSAGLGNAGRAYFLVPTRSGTSPGVTLPGGLVLPVNPDSLTQLAYGPGGPAYFVGLFGSLDGAGDATALVNVPALSAMSGFTVHFAYFLAFPAFDFVSPARGVDLLP